MARLKKKLIFKDSNRIWRILIGSNEKLLIETRNNETKEVFFSIFDLPNGKQLIKNLQLDDKFWTGVEEIYNDIIFFHRFNKPDMPDHKGIIAYDIIAEEILWENEELRFSFISDNKLYSYMPSFESRAYFALNPSNGEIIDELGEDHIEINLLRGESQSKKNSDEYIFPEVYHPDHIENSIIGEIISTQTDNLDIVGNVEYNTLRNLLIFNIHSRSSGNLLLNRLFVYDTDSRKRLYYKVLNRELNVIVPDSFFIYKNILFILRGRSEVELLTIIF
jgi:hypothetical protein